ncbi:MAG TPA: glycerol-3-phosphate dehydrogenase/oxidase [Candidatus Limnocylindria bacterium]
MRSLRDRTVDLLVIGGGIIGAGIARDAALRGLSVALIERDDLASGTSSRPTRLIHGGLRYLELFDFGLVRSDMRERETLLRIAPHLVFPLPFLLPLYRPSPVYRAKLRLGMLLYDLLSLDKSLPKRRWLSRAETLAVEPSLDPEGLTGAWRFYDAQVPLVERLVVENALDAAAHGALVLNHAVATGYLRDGDAVTGARVRDAISGGELELRARFTVNATGPWLDETIASLRGGARPLLRLTKGIHLVTPHATEQAHVLFAADGRLFFVLPWREYTIVGTTDTDHRGDPADAAATADDVRYLQDAARRAFPQAPFDRILFTWAGVRALVRIEGVAEGEVSRKHALYDHLRRDGIAGVLSVIGGKITAYRAIAEEVTDRVGRVLGVTASCATGGRPLPGAGGRAPERDALAAADPALAVSLCEHSEATGADVIHAARHEWAATLADVLLRRTAIGLSACQGLDCLEAVADLMAQVLGWTAERRAAQIAEYRREIAPMRVFTTA